MPDDRQPEVDEVPPEDTLPPATDAPPTTGTPSGDDASGTGSPQPVPPADGDGDGRAGGDLADDGDGDGDGGDAAWLTVGLLGGGVGVAGLLVSLDRMRRAQQRRRSRGERIAMPAPPLAEAEARLRAGADLPGARLVEAALRAAAAGAGPTGLPALRWVEASAADVVLVLSQPAPPAVGFVADGPDRWRAVAPVQDLISLGERAAMPVPLLAAVGRTGRHAEVLVDLEAHGVVTVAGDRSRMLAWLQAVALSTATSPWAVQPRVLVVGPVGDQIRGLPTVEAVATMGEALDMAAARADRIAALLTSLSSQSAAQARAAGDAPDAWEPLLVLSTEPPEEGDVARLRELAARPGRGVAVLCPQGADGSPVGSTCHIDDTGSLRLDGVDAAVRAIQLDDGDVAAMALLEHAVHADAGPGDDARTLPVRTPLTRSGSAGHLDDLLDEIRVLVRVLGDVQVVWRDPGGTERPVVVERQKGLEALCYLAMREAAVDREDLEAALFPNGNNSVKTFQNAVTAARKAITEDLFPAPMGGRYALSERVATDYGAFADLVRRAEEAERAEEAASLLAEALTLVQGEPFTGTGRGYSWIGPHRGLMVAQIVDAADELAEVRLEDGDWRGAEWAARQGLRAFPCDERLYRILMRCAHQSGNVPGVQRVYQELCDAIADPDDGVEPHDTVHPETLALLEELTSHTSKRASA